MNEKLKEILDYYGEEAQANELVKALAELIVVITKEDINKINDQIAWLEVMLDQFKCFGIVDKERVEEIKQKNIYKLLSIIRLGK